MLTRKPKIGERMTYWHRKRGQTIVEVTGFREDQEDIVQVKGVANGFETEFIWRHPDGLNTELSIVPEDTGPGPIDRLRMALDYTTGALARTASDYAEAYKLLDKLEADVNCLERPPVTRDDLRGLVLVLIPGDKERSKRVFKTLKAFAEPEKGEVEPVEVDTSQLTIDDVLRAPCEP